MNSGRVLHKLLLMGILLSPLGFINVYADDEPPFSMDSFGSAVRNLKTAKKLSHSPDQKPESVTHTNHDSCSAEAQEFEAMMAALETRIKNNKNYAVTKAGRNSVAAIKREQEAMEKAMAEMKTEWNTRTSTSHQFQTQIAEKQARLKSLQSHLGASQVDVVLQSVDDALKEARAALNVDLTNAKVEKEKTEKGDDDNSDNKEKK